MQELIIFKKSYDFPQCLFHHAAKGGGQLLEGRKELAFYGREEIRGDGLCQ